VGLSIGRGLGIVGIVVTGMIGGLLGDQVVRLRPQTNMQHTAVTLNGEFLKLAGLGLNATWADLLWVVTLIESDVEHYKGKELDSWMYHRFNTIKQLDPWFYQNYYFGGQYLMVIKDDLPGAQALMEEGLKRYPNDMALNWQLGFLWVFERNDSRRGYPYFEKVSQHPRRPPVFDSLFARLRAEVAGPHEAFKFALKAWQAEPAGSLLKERLAVILHGLKSDMDLDCLNAQRKDCERVDFFGKPYLKNKKGWTTATPRTKSGLFRRKN
jgi:hypothetical protein